MHRTCKDAQRGVRCIERDEVMHKRLARTRTAVIIVLAANEDSDRCINEIGEVSAWHLVIEPANWVERHCRLDVHVLAENDIAVTAGHHQHGFYPTHGVAHEADPPGVDLRAPG